MDMQDLAAACENVESYDLEDGNSDIDFVLMTLENEDLEFNTSTSRNTMCDDGSISTELYNKYPSIGDVSVSIADVGHFESSDSYVPDRYLKIDGRHYVVFN